MNATPQMIAVLRNIAAGRNPGHEVANMKPGAVAGICSALRARGWIEFGRKITDAGREYLANRGEVDK